MDYYKDFAGYYGKIYQYTSDYMFWESTLSRYSESGPVLYVGPGAGRLMKKLILNHEIYGVERSDEMFMVLQDVLKAESQLRTVKPFTIWNHDVNEINCDIKVSLIIIPCNCLTENKSIEDVKNVLDSCRAHLVKHGHLAIEVNNPLVFGNERLITVEEEVMLEPNVVGLRRTIVEKRSLENKLIVEIEFENSETGQRRTLISLEYCELTYERLQTLASHVGFEIVELYGDTNKMKGYDSSSAQITAVLRAL
jgi:hypothetical protein